MTTATTPTWQELFRQQRHALLGQKARKTNHDVLSLADDEVVLVGGASEAARLSSRPKASGPPRSVMLTPQGPEQTAQEFGAKIEQMRAAYPRAEMAGFGPLSTLPRQRFEGLDRGVVLVGRAGRGFEAAANLDSLQAVKQALTAVLLYSPEVTPEALEQALDALAGIRTLVSVVPLPAAAGDRIPLSGLTTSGTEDAMVISVLRLLLPSSVRVRASWAALGWKVAQVALAYGADEIAGWTAAETLAYTGRVRAAARVERLELNEGLDESRCRDAGWSVSGATQ
jgi:hypothetical protein